MNQKSEGLLQYNQQSKIRGIAAIQPTIKNQRDCCNTTIYQKSEGLL